MTVSEKSVAVFVDCLVSEVRIHPDFVDACVIMVFQARGLRKFKTGVVLALIACIIGLIVMREEGRRHSV